MLRLSEGIQIHESFSSDERRPRRSYRPSLGISTFIPHIYERGITGAISSGKKKKNAESSTETHASRFPAIIKGNNVSYDPVSHLFTISSMKAGRGETYYFEDLPHDIRTEIQRLKLHHTSE